jgi:hypothetical protein
VFGVGRVRDVGMELAGEPPERTLDVVSTCVASNAEQLVIVALRAQLSS